MLIIPNKAALSSATGWLLSVRKGIVMENMYEIIGNLLAAFAVALLAYLTPKAKAWLRALPPSETILFILSHKTALFFPVE